MLVFFVFSFGFCVFVLFVICVGEYGFGDVFVFIFFVLLREGVEFWIKRGINKKDKIIIVKDNYLILFEEDNYFLRSINIICFVIKN